MENTIKICQCCGMPLNDDEVISREKDGSLNENYCKWCYADGVFAYQNKEEMIEFLLGHLPNPENLSDEQRREMFNGFLSELKHWQ